MYLISKAQTHLKPFCCLVDLGTPAELEDKLDVADNLQRSFSNEIIDSFAIPCVSALCVIMLLFSVK